MGRRTLWCLITCMAAIYVTSKVTTPPSWFVVDVSVVMATSACIDVYTIHP